MNGALVFLAMFVADIFWTKWSAKVTAKAPYAAANYSALITLCGAFSIVEYTTNHWLLIPACAGAWCGTLGTMIWDDLSGSDIQS